MNEAARDAGATRGRLVEAAARLMTDHGAGALGINALAKAAGCDKQLIYRYFGGLDGVLAALGESVAARLADRLAEAPPARDWPGFSLGLARALMAACRADPLLGRLRAAELSGPPGLLDGFARARGAALAAFVAARRPQVPPPGGVDVPALHALLAGAIEVAAMSAAVSGGVIGLSLADEAGWSRLDAMLARMVAGAYGVSPGGAGG